MSRGKAYKNISHKDFKNSVDHVTCSTNRRLIDEAPEA